MDDPLHAVASDSLPPLHEAGLPHVAPALPAGCTQPVVVLHASAVQAFVSVQSTGGPLRHEPPEQASLDVQALPSLQGVPFESAGFEQTPVPVLHVPMLWH